MIEKVTPRLAALAAAVIAISALGAALIGQYGFGLHPCHLCMYQRYAFGAIIVLGLSGFFVPRLALPMITFSGLTFFINAGIAFFHTGVERKWWRGLEGCSTPDMSGSIQDLIKRIEETAVVKCDEIAWSLFGLSMANYNVILCLVCGGACVYYLSSSFRAQREISP